MDFVDRLPLFPLFFSFVVYPLAAWIVLRLLPQKIRMQLFALLNVGGLAVLCLLGGAKNIRIKMAVPYSRAALSFFSVYVVLAVLHYFVLRLSKRDKTIWPTVAFLSPILFLAYTKYAIESFDPLNGLVVPIGLTHPALFFIGVSYLSFRLVLLVQDVRNDVVEMPNIWEYLSFAFFVPTLSVGPISPYGRFIKSVRTIDREKTPIGRSLLRILVGFTKYIFLGSLLAQFAYTGLLRDGHPHALIDLFIAIPAYALYLYCNFSGFCDMVIGISGLLGIEIMENFDRPFQTRNIQEFWNRWHISLSTWIRDLVFTPLTKATMRRIPPKYGNHAIAASLLVAFFLVGMWHGTGMNFVIFGLMQGIGLVTLHYYTIWLKKRLGRQGFADYRKNTPIRLTATVINFAYFSLSLFFFANNWADIAAIHLALSGR